MKQTLRNNVFETNSSSYHSLTIHNHDKVLDLITQAENIMEDLDTKSEIYEVITKLRQAENLLLESLEELDD